MLPNCSTDLRDKMPHRMDQLIKEGRLLCAVGTVCSLSAEQKEACHIYFSDYGSGLINEYEQRICRSSWDVPDTMKDLSTKLTPATIRELFSDGSLQVIAMVEPFSALPEGFASPTIFGSETIHQICMAKAESMYGNPLPEYVRKWLQDELTWIKENRSEDVFYFYYLAGQLAEREKLPFGCAGSTGSYFTGFLLGFTNVNPLKAHYYCPKCHHFELSNTKGMTGFDLPEKVCPICGEKLERDGFDVPFALQRRYKGSYPDIDLKVPASKLNEFRDLAKKAFGDDNVYLAGTVNDLGLWRAVDACNSYLQFVLGSSPDIPDDKKAARRILIQMKLKTAPHRSGLMIVPKGYDITDFTPVERVIDDHGETQFVTHCDFHDLQDTIVKLDILPDDTLDDLCYMEHAARVFDECVPIDDPELLKMFQAGIDDLNGDRGIEFFSYKETNRTAVKYPPKKISDLVVLNGLAHSTNVWFNNNETLMAEGKQYEELAASRENIYETLLQAGITEEDAAAAANSVRLGEGIPKELQDELIQHGIAQWYIDSCNKIRYLFPKAHSVFETVLSLKLAWFKKYCRELFYLVYMNRHLDEMKVCYPVMCQSNLEIENEIAELQRKLKNTYAGSDQYVLSNHIDALKMIKEIKQNNILISNVHLNDSEETKFILERDGVPTLIPPLCYIKGIDEDMIKQISDTRRVKRFSSLKDFLKRTDIPQKIVMDMSRVDM